ncbi:MAG: glycosyltransferase, partial [Actinomycetota bacterium]|nr:glycosyltransferase [Actinomycetota bacterium]
ELQADIDRRAAPVRLLGRRDDVPDLLAAADLVVLPSRWEARPLAVQEAMQLGRAVVATDVGGVRGLVGHGAALVPADDVDGLAAAVRALLNDPTARTTLGLAGAASAARWPDEAAVAAAVSAVYAGLTVPRSG